MFSGRLFVVYSPASRTMTSMLHVSHLTKSFGQDAKDNRVRVLDDVSFHVERGTFFTLLGPSGCGKTTTMRCVAGLESPDGGSITIGATCVFDAAQGLNVPANKRQVGMVFQSYAIWPHMDVFENAAFPLRVSRRLSQADTQRRVERALETVQLGGLARRSATQLSGGQQQRLALARALIVEPDLLLLDEPLSNLDAKLRETMRSELRRLQRDVGVTTIFVTHDQAEALALSDAVAVMNNGTIAQIDAPRTIYERPASSFVASFIGLTNLVPARAPAVTNSAGGVAETSHGPLHCVFGASVRPSEPAVISIRPEAIALVSPHGETADRTNRLEGTIGDSVYVGDSIDYGVHVGQTVFRVRAPARQRFTPGEAVALYIGAADCLLIVEN
jgi:iron(III) transport system ATP-binding protein